MSGQIQKKKATEIEQEEVPLDEAPVGEESKKSPASSEIESVEADEKPSTDGPSRRGGGGLLRKKWLWFLFAGILMGIVGVILGYGFPLDLPWDLPWDNHSPLKEVSGVVGELENGFVQTGLQPFFVPLREGSENIAVKLDIKVIWEPEVLKKYREKPAIVRNNLLTYFFRVSRSKKGFETETSRLESEIGKILERSLEVKVIKVHLDSVTPI